MLLKIIIHAFNPFLQLGHLDADLNGLKAKLRALFVQFTEYTKTRYNQVNEVSIYGQLLDYEEGRLKENINRPMVNRNANGKKIYSKLLFREK